MCFFIKQIIQHIKTKVFGEVNRFSLLLHKVGLKRSGSGQFSSNIVFIKKEKMVPCLMGPILIGVVSASHDSDTREPAKAAPYLSSLAPCEVFSQCVETSPVNVI